MKDQSQRPIFEDRPLKSLCQMNLKSLGEDTDPDRQIRYIDIGSVSYQEGVTSRETLTFSSAPSRARRCVEKDDIIISTVRTYLRAVAMIDKIDDGAIASTGFAVCRANDTTNSRFLYYAMMAEPFINQVIIKSTGISYPAINASTLGGIKLPVPSQKKQQAISGFLDRETRRIDDLIAEKDSFIALLREKRVAEISHAVTKGIDADAPTKPSGVNWLGDVPAHWDAVPANWLFQPSKKLALEGDQLLSATQKYGVIPLAEFEKLQGRKVTLAVTNLDKRKHVEVGDFVISMRSMDGGLERARARGSVRSSVTVRSDCPACVREWVIVSIMDSGHLEVGHGWDEGSEEAALV